MAVVLREDVVELKNPCVHIPLPERVDRFRLYYQGANDRPLLGFFIGSEYPLFRYEVSKCLPEGRYLEPDDFDVADYARDSERLHREHEQCGGDFIWSASAFWGIPWVEAALGCPIVAHHASGSIVSQPPLGFRGVESIPGFQEDNPWVVKLGEFIEGLAMHGGGRWPIGTTRMRGVSDLLAALYGTQDFLFAMMENPQEIMAVCDKLTRFWIDMGKYQLERIPEFLGGVGSFYYNMWAPPGTIWHQEDAVAMLSPALFETFIRRCDETIAQAFLHCIMHQHPVGYLPVEAYLQMPMTALELHLDEGGPQIEELYEIHLQILGKRPLLIWGNLGEKEFDYVFSRLPKEGLAVNAVVKTPEEAHYLFEKYVIRRYR